jgi:hypothetical protein
LPGDACVGDDDGEGAFGALFEEGPVGFVVVMGAVGVEELHVAGAEDLEAVVEVGSGGEVLGAEAGAGVVDFEEFDGLGGVVADGGGDVGGVAAGCCDEGGEEREGGDRTHESQEYQPGQAALCGGIQAMTEVVTKPA